MIKFFRHFRKSLLTQNKMGKYFKYAFGEIILVVIGILIALQLNTWKENSQKRKTEKEYLTSIVANLEQDIAELKRLIKRDSISFKAYTNILKPFKNSNFNLYTPIFLRTLGDSQFTHNFEGNNIVFEEMKFSGKINFIQSNSLRFSLLQYYNDSESVVKNQKKNNAIINQLKNEAFNNNLDLNSLIEAFVFKGELSAQLSPLDLSFFKLNKDNKEVKKFANRVSLMKGILRVSHLENNHLIEHARKLKALILNYLSGEIIDFTEKISKELKTAILNGNIKKLQTLVSKSKLNTCYNVSTSYPINLLSYSIENNSFDSLKFFIEKGANLELACYDKTPLMYAVKYGKLTMVKYLLEKGADINKISIEGKTALSYAINYKHPKIEMYLRNYKK